MLPCLLPLPCPQGLLRPENLPAKAEQPLFEMAFVFACVWAFGGALCEKDGIKYRQAFDKWWKVGMHLEWSGQQQCQEQRQASGGSEMKG